MLTHDRPLSVDWIMMVIDLSEDTVNAGEKIAPLLTAQIKSEAEEVKTQQSRDGFRPPLDH